MRVLLQQVQGVVGLQVLALADGGEGRRESHAEGQGVVVARCDGGRRGRGRGRGGAAPPTHHDEARRPLGAGRWLEAPGKKGLGARVEVE